MICTDTDNYVKILLTMKKENKKYNRRMQTITGLSNYA